MATTEEFFKKKIQDVLICARVGWEMKRPSGLVGKEDNSQGDVG